MESYNIGKKILKLRKRENWSQRDLAKRIGLSQSSIQKYESGEYKLKKIKSAEKFINIFNTSFDYLFQDFIEIFNKKHLSDFDKDLQIELSKMDIEKLKILNNILNIIIKYLDN